MLRTRRLHRAHPAAADTRQRRPRCCSHADALQRCCGLQLAALHCTAAAAAAAFAHVRAARQAQKKPHTPSEYNNCCKLFAVQTGLERDMVKSAEVQQLEAMASAVRRSAVVSSGTAQRWIGKSQGALAFMQARAFRLSPLRYVARS